MRFRMHDKFTNNNYFINLQTVRNRSKYHLIVEIRYDCICYKEQPTRTNYGEPRR